MNTSPSEHGADHDVQALRSTVQLLQDELTQSNQEIAALALELEQGIDELKRSNQALLAEIEERRKAERERQHLHEALRLAYEELRQSQERLVQQERLRALGQMASGIAHDINNAISPIALYTASLLEHDSTLSQRAREYMTIIQRAIEDVAATVARMREFYRPRESTLQLAPVELNEVVEQVVALTRARWSDLPQQRGVVVHVRTELTSKLPAIMGVGSEIRDALTNLVFNAVDAMPQGGTLTLRTAARANSVSRSDSTAAEHVLVEVRDTGNGMDEVTRRRCLEPFYTTKGERGTGLGLAMVYGMARRHSAELEIESTPNAGTAVRLIFPLSSPAPDGEHEQRVADAPARAMRLLLVDDDPLLIRSLRDALEADGHEVVTADGGQRGIDTFTAALRAGRPFDLVITDLGMPYVDGRKVSAAIKALAPPTPIVLLTGWGRHMPLEGEPAPQVDYILSKPPKLAELRQTLAECASKRG
ncbi:MAG TPA: ATP-binding protein [Steroidobacteraceae bacterium]|nr:ATP-binding protein [Steroidobacteraceae bacterium]